MASGKAGQPLTFEKGRHTHSSTLGQAEDSRCRLLHPTCCSRRSVCLASVSKVAAGPGSFCDQVNWWNNLGDPHFARCETKTCKLYKQLQRIGCRQAPFWQKAPAFRCTGLVSFVASCTMLHGSGESGINLSDVSIIWPWVNTPCCRGAPPPSVTNPCRAGFVSNPCRAALLGHLQYY